MRKLAAEFFAGIGLVRLGIEKAGFEVVFANDIDPIKETIYKSNFAGQEFLCDDVRRVKGRDVPDVSLATASFPCTDLSLAGWRRGLEGNQSSMFWEFARILEEMGSRRPPVVMLENVPSFRTSNNGHDLCAAITKLNCLGYACDMLELDARWWVPQSRSRMFVVGSMIPVPRSGLFDANSMRPQGIWNFMAQHPELKMRLLSLDPPTRIAGSLADVVERLPDADPRWWDAKAKLKFLDSLSDIQRSRLQDMTNSEIVSWRTAYRRTRAGRAVWEIRSDTIAGCLRTSRGGSSRQALVEAGSGEVRVRWMTSREYARLMGAGDYDLSAVSENQALFGLGDAVCVPAVTWLAENYLAPLCAKSLAPRLQYVAGATS